MIWVLILSTFRKDNIYFRTIGEREKIRKLIFFLLSTTRSSVFSYQMGFSLPFGALDGLCYFIVALPMSYEPRHEITCLRVSDEVRRK